MDFKSMTEAKDKLLIELKPMYRPIAPNTSEYDNNLVSFRDAFSPLLTTQQRPGEALPSAIVPCAEGRPLDCSATLSSQWSPSKVVNPSQIFTPIRNPKVSQNQRRRGLPNSPGAYQYKYRIGFGTTTDQATDFQNRNTDSDYFSSNGSGSPRWDQTEAEAAFNIENSNCIISSNNNNNNNSLPRDEIGFNPEPAQYHVSARNLISSTPYLQMYSLPQYQPTIKDQQLISNYVDLWKTSQPSVEQRQLPFDMWQPKPIPCYFPIPTSTAVRLSSIEQSMNIAGRAFLPRHQGFTSNRSFGTWGYVSPYAPTVPKPCYIGYPLSSQEKPLTYPAEVLKPTQAQLPTKIKMEEPSPKTKPRRPKISQSKERVRERSIREKLKTLTEILPYEVCKNSRPSRTMILEKTVEYIASLEEDIKLLEKKLGMKISCEFRMASEDDSPVYSGISTGITNDLASSRGQKIGETFRGKLTMPNMAVAPSRTTWEPSPVARSYVINHMTNASKERSLEQQHQRQLPSNIAHHVQNSDHGNLIEHGLSINSDQQNIRSHLVQGVEAKKFVIPFKGVQSSTLNHSHAAKIGLGFHQKTYNDDFIPFENNPAVNNCHENGASSNANVLTTDKVVAHVKRPMNPFMVFSKEHRSRIMAANPGMDNRTVSRLLGKEWGELPIEEKLPYRNQFKIQLRHLKTQYPEWNYNSYKARMNRAKRTYDKTSSSAVREDEIVAKKLKTNQNKTNVNKTNSIREQDSPHKIASPEAKEKDSDKKDYAAQWRSWLQGGPYFSSAISK